jgi:hypothetical protein
VADNSDDIDYDDYEREVRKLARKINALLTKNKPRVGVGLEALAEVMVAAMEAANHVDRDTAIVEVRDCFQRWADAREMRGLH